MSSASYTSAFAVTTKVVLAGMVLALPQKAPCYILFEPLSVISAKHMGLVWELRANRLNLAAAFLW